MMDWKHFWNHGPQVSNRDFARQVGRTYRRVPSSMADLDAVAQRIIDLLAVSPESTLLDLACGNGLLTSRLAPRVRSVTAVDYSKPLVRVARQHFHRDNIQYLIGDVGTFELARGAPRYDCVVMIAALQFFDDRVTSALLRRLVPVVKEGGRIVLGDVADGDRIWEFIAARLDGCGTASIWSGVGL